MENKDIYKEKSKKTFNGQAEIYDSTYYGKHANKLYEDVILKINEFKPKSLLDVGCGTGTILSILDEKEDIDLSGMDLSQEMLNVAKEKLKENVDLKIGDSEQIPWKENTFDLVICTDSFHHYPEPEKVLREMMRVLKKKGRLIIGDPYMPTPIRQIFNKTSKHSKGGDYKIYSEKEISNLFVKVGLKLISWNKVTYNSFITVAEVV